MRGASRSRSPDLKGRVIEAHSSLGPFSFAESFRWEPDAPPRDRNLKREFALKKVTLLAAAILVIRSTGRLDTGFQGASGREW